MRSGHHRPDITPHDDGVLMYRATLALIARRSRDGLAAQPLLRLSRTTFYRACMSAQRRKGAVYHLAE